MVVRIVFPLSVVKGRESVIRGIWGGVSDVKVEVIEKLDERSNRGCPMVFSVKEDR